MSEGYLYIVLAVIGTATGQTFIKVASSKIDEFKIRKIVFCPYIYFGFGAIAIIPFFINLAMDSLDLSLVYAFTGLHYITVPLSAKLFLKEKISKNMVIGMIVIVSGIILYNL